MSYRLECQEGHHWDSSNLDGTNSVCPVCGAPGETTDREINDQLPPPPGDVPGTLRVAQAKLDSAPDMAVAGLGSEPGMIGSPGASQPPERFGRYRIVKQLGRGGMGSVFLAHDEDLDRQVALKVPHFSAEKDAPLIERFRREARAAATLDHPNICSVYDVGEFAGVHYISMAYVNGQPLSTLIREQHPLPQRAVADLVRKLALALSEAHAAGVVHRDLKPDNIMVNQRHEPVIMDFGLARRDNSAEIRLTARHAVMGSPAYMAPEQVRGNTEKIGFAADVYGLGVVLYELLTGRLPFEGAVEQVMKSVLREVVPPPSSRRSDLDPELEALCLRALQKDADARFGSMREFADALADYLGKQAERETIPLHSTGSIQQSSAKPGSFSSGDLAEDLLEKLAARIEASTQPKRASRWGIWAAGALCGLAVAVLLIMYLRPTHMIVHIDVGDWALESNVVFLLDKNPVTAEQLSQGISVKPGPHTFEVLRDGEVVSEEIWTLRIEDAGGTVMVANEQRRNPRPQQSGDRAPGDEPDPDPDPKPDPAPPSALPDLQRAIWRPETERPSTPWFKSIAILPARIQLTIARDYNQRFEVRLKNQSNRSRRIYAELGDFESGLLAGFVGPGEQTDPITIAAGGEASLSLYLFAQDASRRIYRSDVAIYDAESGEQLAFAPLIIRVPLPKFKITTAVGQPQPGTLARTIKLKNHGGALTDLVVEAGDGLVGQVTCQPRVHHAYLKAGGELEIQVRPRLSTSFTALQGILVIRAAGQSLIVKIDFKLPQGEHVFVAGGWEITSSDSAAGKYCTNNPNTNTPIGGPNAQPDELSPLADRALLGALKALGHEAVPRNPNETRRRRSRLGRLPIARCTWRAGHRRQPDDGRAPFDRDSCPRSSSSQCPAPIGW